MSIQCQITAIDSSHLSRLNTGLGNVLFQVATGYGLSKTYGVIHNYQQLRIYIDKLLSVYGLHHKSTLFRLFDTSTVYSPDCILNEKHHCYALHDISLYPIIQANTQRHIQINGYLQSHLYFHTYRDDIIQLFSIDPDSTAFLHSNFPLLFDVSATCISLHFRTNWGHGITYCIDYYKEAIEWFKQNVQTPHFVVFTDNPGMVRDTLPSLDISYTLVEGNPDYVELWAMSLCKHNILSFSTFSWWGAYLNRNLDKKVFFPYDAMRVSHGIQPVPVLTERLTQHYLPEWTPLYSRSIV